MILSRYSNPHRYAKTRSFDLRFSVQSSSNGGSGYVYEAVVKLEQGVRFISEPWPECPSAELMAHRCSQFGQFSPRPYRAGQATDDSTADCVLALFHHYCGSAGIDPTYLLVRTYSGWLTAEKWSDEAWSKIIRSADWHGTARPLSWSGDAIIGLLVSLSSQGERPLAAALTQEILLRSSSPRSGGRS